MTIAQNMKNIMQKHNRKVVSYLDVDLIEECAAASKINTSHPLKTIQRVLNALDNSSMFEKGYIRADFNGKTRKYRSFKLL